LSLLKSSREFLQLSVQLVARYNVLMPTATKRLKHHRAHLRAADQRQIVLWLPDTKLPAFAAKVRRQCRAIAADDPAGREMDAWISGAFGD
jgi:Protein  of unknown function (DUF3018)